MNSNRALSQQIDTDVPRIGPQEQAQFRAASSMGSWSLWGGIAVGAVLVAVIGTWLVWFSVSLQRKFQVEDIQAACQRVMPETVDRCVDTVIIQRGGARR
jgi:uncharacterized membrane protein YkvI